MHVVKIEKAVEMVPDGTTIMVGGFLGVGTPEAIIDEMVKQKKHGLTVIANDTAFSHNGVGKLVINKLVKKLIVSHIGTNPETQRQMIEKEIDVDLVPQGTLVEKIRAAGVGLGGILTPTGIGTVVENGKRVVEIEGKRYIMELPLSAEISIIKARKTDCNGNLVYSLTARNFNPIMAMAAKIVIAEVDEILPIGTIPPDEVHTPGIFIDYVVVRGR